MDRETEQRLRGLEGRIAILETVRTMTSEERARKIVRLQDLNNRLTPRLQDQSPETWDRLLREAGQIECELGY